MPHATWKIEKATDSKFPFRISVEQGSRALLVLRAQDRWPAPGGQVFCLREKAFDPAEPLELVEQVPVTTLTRFGKKLSLVLDRPLNKRCDFLFLTKPFKNRPGEYEQIFFRTQKSLRQHQSRGRGQLFDQGTLEVVIDSAERYPWKFVDAQVRREKLPAGDYALLHLARIVAVVERKSFDNMLQDFSKIQILHQTFAELAAFPHSALVIEAQYGDFLVPEKVRPVQVTRAARLLAEISALHQRVPVIFAGNRKLANEWASGFFAAVSARLNDTATDAIAEAAAGYGASIAENHSSNVRHHILYECPTRFQAAMVRQRFPQLSAGRMRSILSKMHEEGVLAREGQGAGTWWVRRIAE